MSNLYPDDGRFPALETRAEVPPSPAPTPVAPEPPKPVDDVSIDLTKVDFSQPGKLASAYEASARFNADDNAAAMRIAGKTGLPENFVYSNLPEARKSEGTISKVFLDQIEKDFPNTTKFLSEPRNMAVAHDDIPNLVEQEGLFEKIRKAEEAAARLMFPALGLADQMPFVVDSLAAGVVRLPNTALRLPATMHTALRYADNLSEKIAELSSPEGATRLALGAAVGAPVNKLVGEVAHPTPDSWYNNAATKYFDDLSASIAPIESTWSPVDKYSHGEYANAAKALAAQVLINAPNQAALLSLGLLGEGAQVAGLAGMALQQASDVAARASAKGISPLVFAPAAAASGVAEALFERQGTLSAVKSMEAAFIKALNNGTKGRALAWSFAKQMFSGFIQEGSEEWSTSATQDAIDYISGINPDMTLEKAFQNALDAFLVGGASGVAMTTPTAFMAGRQHMINARHAEGVKANLEKMSKLVAASKVVARGAQFTDGHIPLMQEGGWKGLAHMTKEKVDATAESMGIKPDVLMREVGGLDSYNAAEDGQSIVSMPLQKFSTRLGAHLANVAGDIKLSPDAKSANEMVAEEENRKEAFRVIGEDAAEIIKGDEADAEKSKARQGEYDSVREEIASQLEDTFAGKDFKTDKSRREWIDAAATIHANMVTVAADKAGVSTKDWWAKNKTVTKAMEAISGTAPASLGQKQSSVDTKSAKWKKWFGGSKVVDESGNPKVVYHGSKAPSINVFDYSKIFGRNEGAGFYFTTSKSIASGYGQEGHIVEAYLKIENPMKYDHPAFDESVVRSLVTEIANSEARKNGEDIADGFLSNFIDVRHVGLKSAIDEATSLISEDSTALDQISGIVGSGVPVEIVNRAVHKITGFDGIESDGFSNLGGGKMGEPQTIYVAFFPEQIKSTSNATPTSNPDILKQEATVPASKENPRLLDHPLLNLNIKQVAPPQSDVRDLLDTHRVGKLFPQSRGAGRIPAIRTYSEAEASQFLANIDEVLHSNPEQFPMAEGSPLRHTQGYGITFTPTNNCPKGEVFTKTMLNLRSVLDEGLKNISKDERAAIKTASAKKLLSAGFRQGLEIPCVQCYTLEKQIVGYSAKPFSLGIAEYKTGQLDKHIEAIRDYGNIMRMFATADFSAGLIPSIYRLGIDSARLGSGMGTYTKSLWFLEIFGDTGIKFNISSAAVPSAGIPMDVIRPYLSRYKNASAIFVAFNDSQLENYGNDKDVHLIIPAHLGGGTPVDFVENMTGEETRSYTSVQSEFIEVDGKKKVLHSDKLNGMRGITEARRIVKEGAFNRNPREYAAAIKEASRKMGVDVHPKFEDFIEKPWYEKLIGVGPGEYGKTADLPKIDMSKVNWEKATEFMLTANEDYNSLENKFVSMGRTMVKVAQKSGVAGIDALDPSILKQEFTPKDEQNGEKQTLGLYAHEQRLIALAKNANATTYLHEVQHSMVKYLEERAQKGEATAAELADLSTMAQYVGAKEGVAFSVAQHEKIAEAFVAYLEAGKAPTQELKGAFRRIRNWFLKIVSEARATLGATVTPEIANLFDRQIASESAIAKAREEAGLAMQEIPGEPEELKKIRAEAHASAVEEFLGWEHEKLSVKLGMGLKEVEKRVRAVAEEAISAMDVYRAEEFIVDLLKLEKDTATKAPLRDLANSMLEGGGTAEDSAVFMAAAETHGYEDWHELATAISKSSLRADAVENFVNSRMTKIDTQDPEELRAEAERIVHSEHADEILELEREALEALLYKRKAKADQTAADKANRATEAARRKAQRIHAKATAKDEAYRKLSAMGVQEGSNPRPWVTAERKAAERVAVAMVKKDYAAALKAKGEQILAHAMAAEAARNRSDLTRKFRALSKFVGPHPFITSERGAAAEKVAQLTAEGAPVEAIQKAQERLDSLNRYNESIIPMRRKKFGFALQIDEILSRFGLKEPTDQSLGAMPAIAALMAGEGRSVADIADETGMVLENGAYRKEKTEEFVTRILAIGFPINLPASVFKGSVRPTVQDIRDLSKAVKNIHAVGSGLQSFLEEWRKGDVSSNAEAAFASARDGIGFMYSDKSAPLDLDRTLLETAKATINEKVDGLKYGFGVVQFLTLANILDPNAKEGPWKDNTYRPLAEAESRELVRIHKNIEIVKGLIDSHYGSNDEMNSSGEEIIWRGELNGVKQTLTRAKARIIALNMGNEGNRDRIRKSFGLTQEEVMAMLEGLEKKDWDFAQAVGNHLKTFWPEIVKLEMDTRGVQPVPVKVSPVVTQFGTYEGWYYPLHYDSQKSSVVYGHAVDENGIMESGGYSSAQTEQGHTETRAKEFGAAVLLDLRVLSDHLTNVIHDIEFRRAVIDVNRFLRDEKTRSALEGAIGPTRANLMMDFLRDIAADKKEAMDGIEGGLRWLRYNTTFMALGFKVSSAIVDVPSNAFILSHERGFGGAMGALWDFYGVGMSERREFIHKLSPRMAERMRFIDRDLNDMSRNWNANTGKWAKLNKWRKYAFIVQVLSDQAISEPLWIAVYNEALSEGDKDNAVHRADEAVTRTLGSGSILDRSPFQKGSEYKKTMSFFFSFGQMMLGRYILQNAEAKKALRDERSMESAFILGKSVVMLWVLPGFVESIMREVIRNSAKDDKEGRRKRIIARTALGPLGMLPLVRDVANFASGSSKKSTAKLDLTPTGRSIEIILKPGLDIFHGNTKELPVDLIDMAGLVTGTPRSVTNVLVNFMKWQSGQGGELAWKDLLSRRTKK